MAANTSTTPGSADRNPPATPTTPTATAATADPRLRWWAGMDQRIAEFHRRYVREEGAAVPAHGLLYFGHLYAEYRSVKSKITDQDSLNLLEEIGGRRAKADRPLTWNDVYSFDLELTKYLPHESLIRKAHELRSRYRSVAGHREYDAYLATKPPDLAAITLPRTMGNHGCLPSAPADATSLDRAVESALREDVKYLMSRVYLEYALTPLRESIRTELTRKGVRWTLTFMVLLVAFILISLVGAAFPNYPMVYTLTRISTLGVVVAAGIVGGLVSMLQRIQAASSNADALHSIDSLSNGWRGIFLAPLSGAIFASLLFALFAGGILKGSVFPEIRASAARPVNDPATTVWKQRPKQPESNVPGTANQRLDAQPGAPPASTPAQASSPASTEGAVDTPTAQQGQSPPKGAEGAQAAGAGPTPAGSRVVSSTGTNALPFSSFLTDTGPASGPDFALLIVWAFIAGFAERLVPDTLNRLVTKAAPPAG